MQNPFPRRAVLHCAALATAALMLWTTVHAAPADSLNKPTPPNIIFILADDLGYADIGCYGRPDLKTPNIDRLATRGVRMLQGYANSAVCSATRVALLTGRYPQRVRAGLEEPIVGNVDVGLDPALPTLPSLLKKAGYRTALIGKWHLGVLPHFSPLQSGYEYFYGFRGGALDYFSHSADGKKDLWENDLPVQHVGYLTELLGQRAIELVDRYTKSGDPFLLSLHFNAPHWPWEAPGDQAESERTQKPGSNGGMFHYDGGTLKTYERMVESMDEQIGRVLRTLERNGIAENTLIVFTSDNGGERFSNTWPFSGRKTELLEGGLRVPTLVSWPARIPPGRTSEQVAMTMDWLPTLLAAAGTHPDPASPTDGMNLLPILTGETEPISRKLFWRFKSHGQRAVRDGNLKYLKIMEHTFLFNVVEDPLERANLKSRQNTDYQRLVREWYDWNQTMLPEIPESISGGMDGATAADRYGVKRGSGIPDTSAPPVD